MASGSLNRVILIGNLGVDPELKFTQNGKAILRMRLATGERFKAASGEWQERTEWHTVIVWGNRAEALNKFLTKGHKICVEGRLQTRNWEDKDGNKRYSTEVVANDIVLLGGGRGREGGGGSDFPPSSGSDFPSSDSFGGGGGGGGGDYGDDDIPF